MTIITAETIMHSARIVDSHVPNAPTGWIAISDGAIVATGHGLSWNAFLAPDKNQIVIDVQGKWLAPGFIDLHGHGGGGSSYDDDDLASVLSALRFHRSHGTTRAVLSITSAPRPKMIEQIKRLVVAASEDVGVAGIHLEGPYMGAAHCGASDPALFRAPDAHEIEEFISAADGHLRNLTIDPEREGASEAIRRLVTAGVAVGVGHTGVSYDGAMAAFDLGARLLTHTFNAMSGLHHRDPGPVAAAIDSPHVTLELINDGVHVHSSMAKLLMNAAPGRVALITDSMTATGYGDGDYVLGGQPVRVADGVARVVSHGSLAGSTLTLSRAVRNAVQRGGFSVPDAVRAATVIPARVIGRSFELGRIEVGYLADVVLLDDGLAVTDVWLAGTLVR